MSHLGDALRTYWCGPSGHNFTVARRRRDGTISSVLCLACQKRQAPSTWLFCDDVETTLVTVVTPEGNPVTGFVCDTCLTDGRRGYWGWRMYVAERCA